MILKISVRNLILQKRRNLFLGLSIALGVSILVLINALGAGVLNILFNKMGEGFSGHIYLNMSEKDDIKWRIVRDRERMEQIIRDHVEGVRAVKERLAANGRVLGNGKAVYLSISGINPEESFYEETPVLAGDLNDLKNPAIENPVALFDRMAQKLNVRLHDAIRMRFETVYGQVQTAEFRVVAIMKETNPFLSMLAYCHLDRLKPLLDFRLHETGFFAIYLENLTDPQRAIEQANRLHQALQPDPAGYTGLVRAAGIEQEATVLAIAPDPASRDLFATHTSGVEGDRDAIFQDEGAVMLSRPVADALGLAIGDPLTAAYLPRFEQTSVSRPYRVAAVFEPNAALDPDLMLVHADQLYETVFATPPRYPAQLDRENTLFPAVLKEWILLDRTTTQAASEQKLRELRLSGWRGAVLDVATIHEFAGEVISLGSMSTLVSVVGGVILFFIIQIGVSNMLRTTIRERTREIGTVRAIGMQRRDVCQSFVAEVLMMTLFACLAGIVLAFALMILLGMITLNTGDSEMGFFLVSQHLHFVPRTGNLISVPAIILALALLTAYLPARKAANLSVCDALRHYE